MTVSEPAEGRLTSVSAQMDNYVVLVKDVAEDLEFCVGFESANVESCEVS